MNIFLSYSTRDQEIVRHVADYLAVHGHRVSDAHEISVGESLAAALFDRIRTADAVLFFVSKHSVDSEAFAREIGIAVSERYSDRQIKIVPVLLDRGVNIPAFLSDYLYLDLSSREEEQVKENLDKLQASLSRPEIEGAAISQLVMRKREIELERQLLLARRIEFEHLEARRARQLYFLIIIATVISMSGVIAFVGDNLANVGFEQFGVLLSASGSIAALITTIFLVKREEKPKKEKMKSLLSDLERRMVGGESEGVR